MKRKYLLMAGSIIICAVVILTLMQVRSVRSGPQASTPTPPLDGPNTSLLNPNGTKILSGRPTAVQPKITDLAPNIPYEDKPLVVVQHADGSREMFLLAPDAVEAFLNNLPPRDKLALILPPPSIESHHQAPTITSTP
ncbi:MAG TPA: hypothetical protein VF896_14565 [Anaerolineales bacterium]